MARPRANIDTAALADAFAADGLHGTSSASLAAATGIAKPTLYVHGASKEALFLRAVEAEVERVLSRLYAA
jgi:AcrR family transcriptional regulator